MNIGKPTFFTGQMCNFAWKKVYNDIFFHYLICLEITTFCIKNLDMKISGRTQVFFINTDI